MTASALYRLGRLALLSVVVGAAVVLAFAAGYRTAGGGSDPSGATRDDVVGTVIDADGELGEDQLYAELAPPSPPPVPAEPAPVSSPR